MSIGEAERAVTVKYVLLRQDCWELLLPVFAFVLGYFERKEDTTRQLPDLQRAETC